MQTISVLACGRTLAIVGAIRLGSSLSNETWASISSSLLIEHSLKFLPLDEQCRHSLSLLS